VSADALPIETTIHGRVLVARASSPAHGWLVAFHGYGQNAEDALGDVRAIPGIDAWHVVSVQALHRFYTRGDERVVASWMTRQDRDQAIADNVAYVDRVVDRVVAGAAADRLVFAGFSQGAAMAYRAARLGRRSAAGVIALGGDLPPELKTSSDRAARPWPPVLIGAGDAETWFTADKAAADEGFLRGAGAPIDVVRYRGGHAWTDEFRAAAGRWLMARGS